MNVSAESAAGGAFSGFRSDGLLLLAMGLPAADARFCAMNETTIMFPESQEVLTL
jgi:hypothetical protein